MKMRDKLVSFAVACLITFIGFSLIASPTVEILKVGKKAGNEIISNVLAREANTAALNRPSV